MIDILDTLHAANLHSSRQKSPVGLCEPKYSLPSKEDSPFICIQIPKSAKQLNEPSLHADRVLFDLLEDDCAARTRYDHRPDHNTMQRQILVHYCRLHPSC